jgi:5-methylcytosine-specific restriction endonuclease McrA
MTTGAEYDVMEAFWAASNDPREPRVALLKRYAELVVGQAIANVREASKVERRHYRPPSTECFGCRWSPRDVQFIWHHVIQVQHGGSSSLWNQVPLCRDCHALVHPWLPRPACKGFVSTLDYPRR